IRPRIYKILGISAAANLLAFLVIATTPVLTMKGCDSPLDGGVCQVLDTLYVASAMFGTEREYADAVYDKTDIANSDVTFVDVSGVTPPISYPEGYFQVANPEQYQAMLAMQNDPNFGSGTVPGIPPGLAMTTPSQGQSIFDTQQNLPKQNPHAVEGDLPSGFGSGGGSTASSGSGKKPKPPKNTVDDAVNPDKTPDANAVAQASPSPSPVDEGEIDKFGVYINKRPITAEAKETLKKIDANQIKLDTNFRVTVVGTLGTASDGKTIMLKNAKIVPDKNIKNDPVMEKFIVDWIAAVSSAGWLGYLDVIDKDHKVKNKQVQFTVQQDDTDFYAVIKAQQADANAANAAQSGLNGILSIAGPNATGDTAVFLQSAKAAQDGAFLVLNIHMPKQQVQELVQRKLAEAKDPALTKPSSTSLVTSSSNTAVR
ncbi:MAG TPA: hypothetical protein VL501_06770, partial [Pyrinomonadaceae bacterium]|nr:hypothetical protein [Pyrinomonadaceae bacterium]